jgi:hypothetical protein
MIFPLRGVLSAIAAILLMPFVAAAAPSFDEPFSGPSLSAGWVPSDYYGLKYPGDPANHAVFGMTGSQLSISFPGGADHNMWDVQHAQVARPFLGSGTYEAKVDSAFTGVQEVGLIFQGADHRTFMLFMLLSYKNDQAKAYVERFSYVNGVLHKTTFQGGGIGRYIPAPGPYYVRVTVVDHAQPELRTWRFQWSENGSTWTDLVEGGLEGFDPTQNIGAIQSVGMFAGNGPEEFNVVPVFGGYDARFDYFRYSPPGVAAPSNLVSRAMDARVDLWWEPVAGADGYTVHHATVAGGPYAQVGTSVQPFFSHAGAANGTHHYYVVKASKSGNVGIPSGEVEAVPHALGSLATLPTDGLALLLSASELTYTHDNGDPVTLWPTALTGTSLAFSQGGTPTFVSSGVNGRPAVRFDGVDDYMSLTGTFEDFTQGVSVYVVAKPAQVTPGAKYLLLGNGPAADGMGLSGNFPGHGFQYFAFNQWGGVGWFDTTTGVVAGEPSLISLIQDAGTAGSSSFAEIAKNGVALYGSMVDVPSVASRTLNYIGKSYWMSDSPFQGDIAEVIVYDRKLSVAEQAAVRSYVAAKYGFSTGSNPGTPPPLVAPASLTAVGGNHTVALSWASVAGATGYRVYRSGQSQPSTEIASVSAANFTDNTVVNGFAYSYTVAAYNTQSASPQSSPVSATPAAPVGLPANIPAAGLVLALDAATALQDLGNHQAVTVWRDSSTSNHHATTAGPSPIVVANSLNGKPVIRFDGADDYLKLASGFDNFSAGTSLYMVVRPSTPLTSSKLMVLGNGRDVDNIGFHGWASSGLLYFVGSGNGVSWFQTGPALVAGQASLLSVIQQGGSGYTEAAKNGTPLSGQALFAPPQVVRTQNYIGFSQWGEGTFQGDIAEILLYNRTLTSGEQTAVRQYLAAKYGITVQ